MVEALRMFWLEEAEAKKAYCGRCERMRRIEGIINDKPVTILILDDCHCSTERVIREVRFATLLGAIETKEVGYNNDEQTMINLEVD